MHFFVFQVCTEEDGPCREKEGRAERITSIPDQANSCVRHKLEYQAPLAAISKWFEHRCRCVVFKPQGLMKSTTRDYLLKSEAFSFELTDECARAYEWSTQQSIPR